MPDSPLTQMSHVMWKTAKGTPIVLAPVRLPHFAHTSSNELCDYGHGVDTAWAKLSATGSLRILHLGDSHVRGYCFPYRVRRLFETFFPGQAVVSDSLVYTAPDGIATETGLPGIVYHIVGTNGATASTFLTDEVIGKIRNLTPDLLIVSLGTNEAHSPRYRQDAHADELNALIAHLQALYPSCPVVLTTPPGAYIRTGRRRKKRVNHRTEQAANLIKKVAKSHRLAVYDLFHAAGGYPYAAINWKNAGYMRSDGIHFTPDGYTIQGRLLFEALIKSYNAFLAHGSN